MCAVWRENLSVFNVARTGFVRWRAGAQSVQPAATTGALIGLWAPADSGHFLLQLTAHCTAHWTVEWHKLKSDIY